MTDVISFFSSTSSFHLITHNSIRLNAETNLAKSVCIPFETCLVYRISFPSRIKFDVTVVFFLFFTRKEIRNDYRSILETLVSILKASSLVFVEIRGTRH